MKKIIKLALLTIFLIVALLPSVAFADMGPKPSVMIKFEMPTNNFYATLIAPRKEWFGPWQAWEDISEEHKKDYYSTAEDFAIAQKFATYVDADGYIFSTEFSSGTDGQLRWGYHPPDVFKVLVYFPETDAFVVSESCESYAFDSYFKCSLDNECLTVAKTPRVFLEILTFFARVTFTLAIEIGIAFALRYKDKKQFALICIVNAVTQVILNVALSIVMYNAGAFAFIFTYIIAEFFVFVFEAIIYAIFLNKVGAKQSIWKHIVYALIANLASLLLGFGISAIFSLIPIPF